MLSAETSSRRTREICALAPVIPVLVIEEAARAAPLARALVAGGLSALEVTLRTPAALQAIREMSTVDGAIVGAGTVITPEDAARARDAGAQFAVSPGATSALLEACAGLDLPLLPGAVTASEVMQLLASGHDMLKFFPAEAAGGIPALKSLGGPLPQAMFCPTGGLTAENAVRYLALPNVVCVGGSWVAPPGMVAASRWDEIEALARTASLLHLPA